LHLYCGWTCRRFCRCRSAQRLESSTWDEPLSPDWWDAQLQTDPRLNADHPPLARLLGALPSIFIRRTVAELARCLEAQTCSVLQDFGTIEDRLLWPSLDDADVVGAAGLAVVRVGVTIVWPASGMASDGAVRVLPGPVGECAVDNNGCSEHTFIFAYHYTWWRYLQQPSPHRLAWVCRCPSCHRQITALILVPSLAVLEWYRGRRSICASVRSGSPIAIVAGRRWQ
jgi:hypothetical protein